MLFKLNEQKWNADLAKSGRADLVGYQEAGQLGQRRAIKAWAQKNSHEVFHPPKSGNPISWDTRTFAEHGPDGKPFNGVRRVHLGAKQMGVEEPMNPLRGFTWVGLRHKEARKSVLRINVHPVAGATREVPKDDQQLSQWKNWGFQQFWLDIVWFTAREMSRPVEAKSTKRFWDLILLGGDYNGDLLAQRDDEWYYPSRMLPALYAPDRFTKGLDHLQHVHGSDCQVVRRWTVQGYTDHQIHFVSRSFRTVDDTPGR